MLYVYCLFKNNKSNCYDDNKVSDDNEVNLTALYMPFCNMLMSIEH